MNKASNILAKVTAIVAFVISAFAIVGTIYMVAAGGGVFVGGLVMALLLLAAAIVLTIFSKKDNAIAQIVAIGVALVVIIVARFAVVEFSALAAILFALISGEIYVALAQVFGWFLIIIMCTAIAALVLKIVAFCLKK